MKRLSVILLALSLFAGCAAKNGADAETPAATASIATPMPSVESTPSDEPTPTEFVYSPPPTPELPDKIAFEWQSGRAIKPSLAPGVDADLLKFAFYDAETGAEVYADYDISDNTDAYQDFTFKYYLIENGAAMFLFEIDNVRRCYDFDCDGIAAELFAVGAFDYNEDNPCYIYQYSGGVLRQTDLRNTLDAYIVGFGGFLEGYTDECYGIWELSEPTMNIYLDRLYTFDGKYFTQIESGEPDKLGSWSSINTMPVRGFDWRQIVAGSGFQLGERSIAGYWGSGDDRTPRYSREFGTYPRIDGSTVCVPLAVEFARQHLGMTDEQTYNFVSFHTTHDAYASLIQKNSDGYAGGYNETDESGDIYQQMDGTRQVDIIFATYPSDEELNSAGYAVPLTIEPVCADAFVFITHKDNPVDSLTLEQVRKIYSGGITNWSEVGGLNAPIRAYQREQNSGSQSGMEQLVMNGTPMLPPETAVIISGMEGLVNTIAEYQNGPESIGYTYKFYIDTLYKNDNIKILKIDGFDASDSEHYPLTVNYYGVIRANDGSDSVGRKFLDWVLSDEGQQCVEQAGYKRVK
ncbi:MAG: substrate-binding domain-containing protein [Oscillospiraceae bacterium]|jgi:phosphate transport system substrate-binding protein|nr:substrate-binding domain-containing protein [Oscillospiraceae bacterium]